MTDLGGLVGRNYQGTVSNSYATGTVTGTEAACRRFGGIQCSTGTVTASYYNTETTGQNDIGKGEGKTTAESVDTYGLYGYLSDME